MTQPVTSSRQCLRVAWSLRLFPIIPLYLFPAQGTGLRSSSTDPSTEASAAEVTEAPQAAGVSRAGPFGSDIGHRGFYCREETLHGHHAGTQDCLRITPWTSAQLTVGTSRAVQRLTQSSSSAQLAQDEQRSVSHPC